MVGCLEVGLDAGMGDEVVLTELPSLHDSHGTMTEGDTKGAEVWKMDHHEEQEETVSLRKAANQTNRLTSIALRP